MESHDLIRVLKEIPECRLRLIDLAREMVGDDGSLDTEKLGFRRKELEEAIAEAEAYAKATREAVQCLISMDHSQS